MKRIVLILPAVLLIAATSSERAFINEFSRTTDRFNERIDRLVGGNAFIVDMRREKQNKVAQRLNMLLANYNENSTDEETFAILVLLSEYKSLGQ